MECYPVSLYSLDTTSVSKASIGKGKPKIKKVFIHLEVVYAN
jgi:hypothetical protein